MSTPTLQVLHVVSEPGGPGAVDQGLQLARGLAERGDDCTLACQPGSLLHQRARDAGLATLPVVMRHAADWPAVGTLREFIQRHRVPVVHAHDELAHALMALATRGGLAARVVTRASSLPLRRGLERLAYQRGVDHVVATSSTVATHLRQGGVSAERVSVVPPGVPIPLHVGLNGYDPAALRTRLGVAANDGPILATFSDFRDGHGLGALLDAACELIADHPRLRLVIVGEGDGAARIGARATRAGIAGRLLLPGALTDVQQLLPLVDVFCEPRAHDGRCNGLATALAAGLPVVAVQSGTVDSLVRPQRTGLLVPPDDPTCLAEALRTLLDNQAWARRMGAAGRRLVRERHSLPAMVQDVRRLYTRLLPRRAGAG